MGRSQEETGPWTVRRLLEWTSGHLGRHGVESPRLCAEILLAHALGCPRIHLYTRYDAVPEPQELEAFRSAVREAAGGRPIAYITGTKEFFSLEFRVTPAVLIPRPETEILVERTIRLMRDHQGSLRRVLDLGTGSGCIAVSLARHLPEAEVFASDIAPEALEVARENAQRHGVADRIRFALGDLFEPWRSLTGGRPAPYFDVIVSNPPYVSTAPDAPVAENVRQYEPHTALFAGPDGLEVIRGIVAEAPEWLTAGGHLLLEIAFDQAEALRGLLGGSAWQNVTSYRDGAGYERVMHARRRAAGSVQVA